MNLKLKLLIALFGVFLAVAIPTTVAMLVSKRGETSGFDDAIELNHAIETYYVEYRKFPTRTTPPEDSENPEFSDRILMAFLVTPSETDRPGMCPRHVSFASFRKADRTGSGKFRSGASITPGGDMNLWDPWGNHYRVVMDLDGDKRIPAPSFDPDGEPIPKSVIVWSPGPDGDDATFEDNIMTWRP